MKRKKGKNPTSLKTPLGDIPVSSGGFGIG